MSILRIFGVVIGLILSFFAMLYMLFCIGTYTHEPGVPHRLLNCMISCLPLIFTSWIVYQALCTEEMKGWEILGFFVRPAALLRTMVAELLLFLGIMILFFGLLS